MQSNWKILIVTSGDIIEEYYVNDKKFNKDNYVFFNVSKIKLANEKYNIINSCDIPGYVYLGKDYAESEVIYNVSRLGLFNDSDFIGILHYDFNFYSPKHQTYRITENISNILDKFSWISFFPADYGSITGYYDVLMDERKPNCLFVRNSGLSDPRSCLEFINKDLGIERHSNGDRISLCCSFICDKETFYDLGNRIGKIIESDVFDKFDVERRHRFPGQFMERYVASYSLGKRKFDFGLDHRFTGGRNINMSDPNGENY